MSEIKPGNKVLYLGSEHEVIATDPQNAWIKGDRHLRGIIIPLDKLTKIEPFFELGKRYKYKPHYRDHGRFTWLITNVHEIEGEKLAIGARYRTSDGEIDGLNAWDESEFREMEEVSV